MQVGEAGLAEPIAGVAAAARQHPAVCQAAQHVALLFLLHQRRHYAEEKGKSCKGEKNCSQALECVWSKPPALR